jgi:uncharacterized membrane protein HdeD (DUF308 family)
MARTTSRRSARPAPAARRTGLMVFSRRNYVLLLAGVLAIVIGYVMMRLENEVDGFLSLYVAPLIILGGYLEIIYAILWRPKGASAEAKQPAA